MTTTSTVLRPTSDLRFIDRNGYELASPPEWTAAFIDLPFEPDTLDKTTVTINHRATEVVVRRIGPTTRMLAVWGRAGPGWYEIEVRNLTQRIRKKVRLLPSKISEEAFGHMLDDLERRLPVAVAIALRDNGARISVETTHVAKQTLASEVARLRRAVYGAGAPGLLTVLGSLASEPHRMLVNTGEWVRREQARRPDPKRLRDGLWRAGNASNRRLRHVVDSRVEHTVDLYENRVLKAFATEVEQHLRRLAGVLEYQDRADLLDDVVAMLHELTKTRRLTEFLNEVSDLRTSPDRVTMVILKRREYRAAYEGFLEFRKRMSVHLDEPILNEPLQNLPLLYQHWGTLLVVEAMVHAAGNAGYTVASQRLVWPHHSGIYVRVLEDGTAALEMKNDNGDRLRLYPERSYTTRSSPLGSVSFWQRPDIAVELTRRDASAEVYLFDPKYKLVSEEDADPGDGTPKKVDIDKMHAYRDAIRDSTGRHVVSYAATMYPGETVEYEGGLAALRMYPGEEAHLRARLAGIFEGWLATT